MNNIGIENQKANINTGVNNSYQNKESKNIYVVILVIVGFVLAIAIFLVILLLTGNINGKNRLLCTKTTNENGYTLKIDKYYKFQDGVMKSVNYLYTYDYIDNITDEFYNEKFKDVIDNRITGYGYDTQITREQNTVKITAFEPSFFNESYDTIISNSNDEGYTCE